MNEPAWQVCRVNHSKNTNIDRIQIFEQLTPGNPGSAQPTPKLTMPTQEYLVGKRIQIYH